MAKKSEKKIPLKIFIGLFLFGFLLCVFWSFLLPTRQKEGAKEIVWGKHVCAHCGMHINDPHFASQIQTQEKKTFFFDDTGCLVKYIHEQEVHSKSIRQIYFRHVEKDQWLSQEQAQFVRMDDFVSPMGYNFGAFEKGEKKEAINFIEMKKNILKNKKETSTMRN